MGGSAQATMMRVRGDAVSKMLREPVAWVGSAGISVCVLVREGHVGARAWRRSGAVSMVPCEPVAWVGLAWLSVRVRVCARATSMRVVRG